MRKILIVEDDFIIQLFIKQIITGIGHEIVGVSNTSNNVLKMIENLQPEIVLMDISIEGGLDGIELSNKINELFKISIVYLTGNSDKFTMEKAKKTNPLHIIIKPIDEASLIENFNTIIEKYNRIKKE